MSLLNPPQAFSPFPKVHPSCSGPVLHCTCALALQGQVVITVQGHRQGLKGQTQVTGMRNKQVA